MPSMMNLVPHQMMENYEALKSIITQWNANRLDLFELSLPNEQLEFHGVMRFYYQSQDADDTGQKVATKCIRVSSTATTKSIIETLIEKFRPDMRMLEVPEYALYEIHESGERRLNPEEKPLLVQLNWHKDDREGRFLLRRIDEASRMPEPTKEDSSFKRKLSKREKKQLKKQEKMNKIKDKENSKDESVAEKLYTELPDTSFTRSISNPEAVMRRRRQQKLEKKLQQFRSKDGGPDTGGTLKIYGEALCRDVPYKTLLLSISDTAVFVVEEMLEKYGIDRRSAPGYCLIQAASQSTNMDESGTLPREYFLDDDDCPLAILMNHPQSKGTVTFHVIRKPADFQPRKRKKKLSPDNIVINGPYPSPPEDSRLPVLVELNPDGSEMEHSFVFQLNISVTKIGSDPSMGQALLLPPGPFIHPRHCVIAHTDGIVTITPSHRDAETYINNQRIFDITILQHGSVVRFGRGNYFRFIDPMFEERMRTSTTQINPPQNINHNNNNISRHTPTNDSYNSNLNHSNYVHYGPPQQQSQLFPGKHAPPPMGRDHILPAVLEFSEDTENDFFDSITMNLDVNSVQFKLAPTYTIYMATRFRASTHYRPELIPQERAVRLTDMLSRVAEKIFAVIRTYPRDAPILAFWMANSSECLHFLKSDRHITAFSIEAQDILAETVHSSFKQLVIRLQADLELVMPQIFALESPDFPDATVGIVKVLSSAMSLLRKCRVNAALTIQLFSQLFHFINMWTFNRIVVGTGTNYCTHYWGVLLKKRIAKVEQWAEKQGLELAADCHLARIIQAAHLLMARKNSAEDIASVSSICFKLNSLQLRTLLKRYEPGPDESPISIDMIDTIVRVAENTVDELTNSEGREVRLEEDFLLQLPFLLPEDGYSCDIVRGIPGGLTEFLAPLQRMGLCVMTPQPTSSGLWTIYMDSAHVMSTASSPQRSPSQLSQIIPQGYNNIDHRVANEPEIQIIKLSKSNSGMGLSIIAAKGVGKDKLGIYIKAVVEGGAAYHDGRLQAGDQLIKVDGQSLIGITQEKAAEIMMHTGKVVELEVGKQGAIFHGLATLLSQPSPLMSRPTPTDMRMIPQSKSVPTLAGELHTYQNHKPGPPPPSRGMVQPVLHSGGGRSSSFQNLNAHQQYVPPPSMGYRQGSIPILNRYSNQTSSNDDQNYYQNINGYYPPPPPSTRPNHPQYPVNHPQYPISHNNRFGSQSSLQHPPLGRSPSTPIYNDRIPEEHIHHATPRLVGTPVSSNHQPPYISPRPFETDSRIVHFDNAPPASTASSQSSPVRSNTTSTNRVRFQEPQTISEPESSPISVAENELETQLDKLRVANVEQEFRRRVNEYENEHGSSEFMENESYHHLHQQQQQQFDSSSKRSLLHKKQKELEDTKKAEDRILNDAQNRTVLPPVPVVPPPASSATPPPSTSGAQRLDQLIGTGGGSNSSGGNGVLKNGRTSSMEGGTPTKKVSFSTDKLNVEIEDNDEEDPEASFEESSSYYEEHLLSLERVKQDPNAFINEAESLMNSSDLEARFDFDKSTGHTPSVIGAQEVYRDPRTRRLQREQEEKAASARNPDGANLSFKEKMRLFAVEAGEDTPKEKAKISRAQRNISEPAIED
ncbi:afadin [Lepeophtheirus salmonis]|uniref:afadin n=1 Tax=Lepeophtheirus salmonis TaxID=72036 RepID=UPI001AE829CA|nr:afadin-like [Lepeophtheirus salmonis]